MQRKATKTTRGPNAKEKRFQKWVAERYCSYCHNDGPSIVDHSRGATFKHNKVLVGHWFVTPKCPCCDNVKTFGNRNWHNHTLHLTERDAWLELIKEYDEDVPQDVIDAITDLPS